MKPAEVLAGLALPDAARRDKALVALRALLALIARRHSEMREADSDAVAQVIDRVFDKLVERSPLPVVGKSDGECYGYCRTSVHNLWHSYRRQEGRRAAQLRLVAHEPPPAAAPGTAGPPAPVVQQQLERVFDEYLRGVEERYHEGQRRAWMQLKLMFWGMRTLDEVLADEGVTAGATREEYVKARNRIATNHKRVRRALADTVRQMAALGRIGSDDADALAEYLLKMLRCQTSPRHASDTTEASRAAEDRSEA